jgi:ferric-dicitrate binding protein FerR (iron transport regulator)
MNFRASSKRLIALSLVVAVLHLPARMSASTSHGAENWKPTGELTTFGLAKIDGELALSGQTVFSGSRIETAEGTTSLINLGARGRLELLGNSSIGLSFDESALQGLLNAGRARFSVPSGIKAQVSTKAGTVISEPTQPAIFSVGFWNDDLIVSVMIGRVELRTNGRIEQVSAGQFAFLEDSSQTQPKKKGASRRKLAAILLPIGGALVVLAFVFARGDETPSDFGGCVHILSPTNDSGCP